MSQEEETNTPSSTNKQNSTDRKPSKAELWTLFSALSERLGTEQDISETIQKAKQFRKFCRVHFPEEPVVRSLGYFLCGRAFRLANDHKAAVSQLLKAELHDDLVAKLHLSNLQQNLSSTSDIYTLISDKDTQKELRLYSVLRPHLYLSLGHSLLHLLRWQDAVRRFDKCLLSAVPLLSSTTTKEDKLQFRLQALQGKAQALFSSLPADSSSSSSSSPEQKEALAALQEAKKLATELRQEDTLRQLSTLLELHGQPSSSSSSSSSSTSPVMMGKSLDDLEAKVREEGVSDEERAARWLWLGSGQASKGLWDAAVTSFSQSLELQKARGFYVNGLHAVCREADAFLKPFGSSPLGLHNPLRLALEKWRLELASLAEVCVGCLATGKALKKCSGCRKVSYCGRDCQKEHWKFHKATCKTN